MCNYPAATSCASKALAGAVVIGFGLGDPLGRPQEGGPWLVWLEGVQVKWCAWASDEAFARLDDTPTASSRNWTTLSGDAVY